MPTKPKPKPRRAKPKAKPVMAWAVLDETGGIAKWVVRSLRDWFAGQALASRAWQFAEPPERIADWAYAYADAMLAERAKGQGEER